LSKFQRWNVLLGVTLALGLTTTAYIAVDPRERVLNFVPVLDGKWRDPWATAIVEHLGDSWIYPVSKLPTDAIYEDDSVIVWIRGGNVGGISERFDAATRTAFRSGFPFFIDVSKKRADVEVNVEQLEVLEPCGPDPIRELSGKPQFKVVPYTFEPPPCSICIYSPDAPNPKEGTHVLIVLQGTKLTECNIGFREAIKLPVGQEVPNLKFRAIPWLHVPYADSPVIP
jgi:hypothetical protein